MKNFFPFLLLLLFLACSSSKYSLPDKYPLTQISSDDGIELYKYRSTIGNTCLIAIMPSKDDPKVTIVSGILVFDFLNLLSTLDKNEIENQLSEIIKKYDVSIIDDKIIFIDGVNENLKKIPQSLLLERVKDLGEFTCAYSAMLEELLKKVINIEEEE